MVATELYANENPGGLSADYANGRDQPYGQREIPRELKLQRSGSVQLNKALAAAGFETGEIFQLAHVLPTGGCVAKSYRVGDQITVPWTENVYLCCNPLKELKHKKAKNADIAIERCLLFDVDPEKTPEDPNGLSEQNRELTLKVVQEARDLVGGAIVDSGRGHQLWIQHEPEAAPKRKALLGALRHKLGRAGVTIDATHDACRLMRLPGTVNSKTGRTACLTEEKTR